MCRIAWGNGGTPKTPKTPERSGTSVTSTGLWGTREREAAPRRARKGGREVGKAAGAGGGFPDARGEGRRKAAINGRSARNQIPLGDGRGRGENQPPSRRCGRGGRSRSPNGSGARRPPQPAPSPHREAPRVAAPYGPSARRPSRPPRAPGFPRAQSSAPGPARPPPQRPPPRPHRALCGRRARLRPNPPAATASPQHFLLGPRPPPCAAGR